MALAPRLDMSRTVRIVFSALPKPVSQSTISGIFVRSVITETVSATSVMEIRPTSDRAKRV